MLRAKFFRCETREHWGYYATKDGVRVGRRGGAPRDCFPRFSSDIGVGEEATPTGIFTVLDAAKSSGGLDVPVRSGQNVKPVFGKAHACGKHSILCGDPMDAAVVVVEQGTKDPNRPPENPNWTANLYNKQNLAETEDIRVGVFTGNVLAPLGPTADPPA